MPRASTFFLRDSGELTSELPPTFSILVHGSSHSFLFLAHVGTRGRLVPSCACVHMPIMHYIYGIPRYWKFVRPFCRQYFRAIILDDHKFAILATNIMDNTYILKEKKKKNNFAYLSRTIKRIEV